MKLARFVSLVALSGSLLAGCGPEIPPAGNYATVAGVVEDATTLKGIGGATVSINGGVLIAQTDASGNFKVYPVPTGDWDYTASANGYSSTGLVTSVAPLGPSQILTITITLTKSS